MALSPYPIIIPCLPPIVCWVLLDCLLIQAGRWKKKASNLMFWVGQ